jgi:hypothetical protein
MRLFDQISWPPTRRELAWFGIVTGAASALAGAWLLHGGSQPAARACFAAGFGLPIVAHVPWLGPRLYFAWMALGAVIGAIMGPIVLTFVYVTMVVPIGLWFRIVGRDSMRRSLDRAAPSYWESYPQSKDPSRYLRQY